eukprot:gnl/Chilomastix_cuspidata/2471.p1 GENE.gnl/Chilomastix_cuspidata/2471~~gnl/Chilomastix_cuspidata/2471.p1  ORF type:complete len:599 (+),score=121.54 gnl/Chilomastix_cuspidata/2471:38-1798(+)
MTHFSTVFPPTVFRALMFCAPWNIPLLTFIQIIQSIYNIQRALWKYRQRHVNNLRNFLEASLPPQKRQPAHTLEARVDIFETLPILESSIARDNELHTLFSAIAALDPSVEPMGPGRAAVARLARVYSVTFTPKTQPTAAHEARAAATFAQKHTTLAWKEVHSAKFFLDTLIARQTLPIDAAATDFHAHKVAVAQVQTRMCVLAAARTSAVRAALAKAFGAFGFTERDEGLARIDVEAQLLTRLERRIPSLMKLHERALRLEALAAQSVDSARQHLVHPTLAEFVGTAACVDDFCAFLGAESLPEVEALLSAPLYAGAGALVSKRQPVRMPLGERNICFSSVSTGGVLCASVWKYFGNNSQVYLFDLGRRRHVAVRIPDLWVAFAFDERLYVGAWEATALRHAPMKAVFAGLPLAEFDTLTLPGRLYDAVTDRAAAGEIVVLTGWPSRLLVRIDLRSTTSCAVWCDSMLDAVGPLSSICVPGALCTARRHGHNEDTVLVFQDGRTEVLTGSLGYCPTFLPSSSVPADPRRGILSSGPEEFSFGERAGTLEMQIAKSGQSLARIFKDIFLRIDRETRHWYMQRMVVL